jgi:hypothetical protein
MKALSRGVKRGDRRLFYCMHLPFIAFTATDADVTCQLVAGHSEQMPCLTGSEEDNMDEGKCPQTLSSFYPH